MIKTNLQYTPITSKTLQSYQTRVNNIHNMIISKKFLTDNQSFLGWVDFPIKFAASSEWKKMNAIAQKWQAEAIEVLVVVGIGGSYLGTRAAVEMIQGLWPVAGKIELVYLGNSFSSTYTSQTLEYLKTKKFAINVISKSGTTTESAIGFRLAKALLEEKVGKNKASELIVATTDANKGILKELAKIEHYETLTVPDDIGGRYSVLTAVGLFPLLVAGIDIVQILQGAEKAHEALTVADINQNEAYKYAVARHFLNTEVQKTVEVFCSYEMQLQMFHEWWKQLFGESEGKADKGLFPASVIFSTDLHSLGQFLQDGTKIFFQTVVKIVEPNLDININSTVDDLDQLNYLTDKSLHKINNIAFQGTLKAHSETAQTPNIVLEWNNMTPEMFGYAAYFFMRACAMSAMLLEVDPFDQPGVEVYKKNMFALLGKK